MSKKNKKVRTHFRKNRNVRTRTTNWTRQFDQHGFEKEDTLANERVSGKGELTKRRTVRGAPLDTGDEPGFDIQLDVEGVACQKGRVLSVNGLISTVENEEGECFQCATRGLLKTLSTDQRHVVAAGDRALFRVVESTDKNTKEGVIERIEPRTGSICRTSKGRQQIIVTNVDQVLIIASAAEPRIKPNLIDRMLLTADKSRIEPVICINKIDLTEPASLQPMIGVYSQMGYRVILTSAQTGFGLERLCQIMSKRESVVTGQSGVGKSSLLNALEPNLGLLVKSVSEDTQKGRHTTTTARLLPLSCGGYVVDTPGIRHFQLWDVTKEEVAGFYRDIRPYINHCKFPDCTHTHEYDCAVKSAVADGRLDERRYESYCHLLSGDID